MLEIYGRASSSNVQKVLWLCEELGLPYRTSHDVPPGKAGTDDYKCVNPTGKIPTLIEPDGFTLWESNAILRYLGAKHGAGSLWPDDLRVRADVDRWMDWQNCAVAPVATIVLYQTLRAKPEEKNPAALAAASQAARDAAGLLDAQLKGKAYVVGDAFTLADIALGQWVWRYVNLVEQRPDQPHLMAWHARLQDRAAYKKIVMTKLV